MQRRTTFFSVGLCAATFGLGLLFSACTSILGDFDVIDNLPTSEAGATETGTDGPLTGKANGAACTTTAECGSSFCVDGVCCESACSGTCESCALAEKGKCLPVPDGQDPDKECLPEPRPDAGSGEPPDGGGPTDDASVDGGTDDGGNVVNVPDGGLVSHDEPCAGRCNGNRQCKFPGKNVTCGTQFCNSTTEGAGLRCDGKGRCDLQFATCNGFVCGVDGECKKNCTKTEDCDSEHFCKEGACIPKLADGTECSLPTQCASGFCIIDAAGGVCCNSDCNNIPGGNCKKPGSVGQCKCSIDCGNAACRLFYQDFDGDKHGDVNANPNIPNTTKVGCEGSLPPGGYSADKDDCNDQDARVFKGQTEFFDSPAIGTGSFDFNCDGIETKQTKEYPGGSCRFCGPPEDKLLTCSTSSTTACYYAKQSATLTCKLTKNTPCLLGSSCYDCDGSGGRLGTTLDKGFTTTVECGKAALYTDCGACLTKGGAMPAPVTTAGYPQKCR
jgi:hypothetical protein